MIETAGSIRLAGVVRESIVDGPGIRFVVFCQGCPHHCQGCHNEQTHSFMGGYDCSIEKILNAIDSDPLLDGVTFSGGEPVCQPAAFLTLAREIRKRNLNILMYSGYTYEEILEIAEKNEEVRELMLLVDILVDGKYKEEERDLSLNFRGSRNQRIIDVRASRENDCVSLIENL